MRSLHATHFLYSLLLALTIPPFRWVVVVADVDDDNEHLLITCGSAVKIEQRDTEYYLNSEEKQLGNGSGQQIVTFTKDPATPNTLWHVRPANHRVDGQEYPPDEATCQLAEPVECDTIIRLTHVDTGRNLHSHDVESVLSRQQEITAYGTGDRKGDAGDNWKLHCAKPGQKYWQRNSPIRLQHVDTGKFLGTAKNVEFNTETCGHSCPLMGHLEAFGRGGNDAHTLLMTHQGIFLSK
jgi:dolichyl-phosphate-mannose--protein O-mannosyl transferase